MTNTLELTPSGTSTKESNPDKKITESGASVIREQKDLFKHWEGRRRQASPSETEDTEGAVAPNIEDAPSLENQILFGLIRDPRVRLVRPIPIEIRREGDGAIACWAEADEFGQGNNRSEAMEDFGRTISQLFISLTEQEKLLGSDLQCVLTLLRKHMSPR